MATMSKSYLVQAVRDDQVLARGTAWFVDAHTVVTAFHVVGEERSGEWLSAKLPALYYRLLAGTEPILLEPLAFDETADIALLKALRTPVGVQIMPLADATVFTSGATWDSEGFPAFHDGVFGLRGIITRSDETTQARALQLIVEQGTQVDWSGMSGAPVWIGQRVAGLITLMTSGANTVWAASASAIRGLYERRGQSTLTPKRVTRDDLVRRILQHLSQEYLPGVALLESLRFDARSIVREVMKHLQDPARHML
jgi:hypothetical protein